ncbi:folate/biopterin family MFS transporter [Candidatus Peregrinibacteria bacterium]|nr:folate/biopterin family MFS transporter [Candidatus Peregrinibacteria bacterium]
MNRDSSGILIPFVYFIAGASSLAGVATTFYYKEDLGLSIAQASIIGSLSIIPWSIKPLYGLLSDRIPLMGLRRKPYLFLAGLFGASGYFSMATWVHNFSGAIIATILSGLGFALADVIVDGIVAEKSKNQSEAGKLQSVCRASIMTGALLVAYVSGILTEMIGPRNVFWITGTLPLLTSVLSLCISESPALRRESVISGTWKNLKSGFSKELLMGVLFMFVWRATPNSGGALGYYEIDVLGFSPEFFGRLSLISHAMGIVGVVIFRKLLLTLSLRKLFCWVMILSVVLSLPAIGLVYGWYELLGVSPRFFAMADTLISGPLTEIGFLPLLVLAARLCPKGVEATMFALLASIMNIGLAVSDMGGALLVKIFHVNQATETLPADYTNLHIVLWIAILSSLLPWPLLRFLPETRTSEELDGTSPSARKQSLDAGDRSKAEIA